MPICGGNWNNTANAGVFNVNLNNPRSISNSNVGFRSALLSYARTGRITVLPAVREIKGACFRSGPQGRRKMAPRVRMRRRLCGDKQSRRQLWKPQVTLVKAATQRFLERMT